MKENLSKRLSYILYALIGVSVLLTVLFYLEIVSVPLMLNWTYALLAITLVSAVVFPIIVLAQNPKKAKGALVSLIGLVIVFGVGYMMASDTVFTSYEAYGVDTSISKGVGTGLIATYVLMALSGGGIVFFGIVRIFKG
ncbi:MAG: hypothetical protein JKY52_20135 [Flavobacteriales bacterium]|nr:hypothetical protein [Flavobacteriales bacterium]